MTTNELFAFVDNVAVSVGCYALLVGWACVGTLFGFDAFREPAR